MGDVGLFGHKALCDLCAYECCVSAPWRVCLSRPCERSVAQATERVHGPAMPGCRHRALMRPSGVACQGTWPSPACARRVVDFSYNAGSWGSPGRVCQGYHAGALCQAGVGSTPGEELHNDALWSNTSSMERGGG